MQTLRQILPATIESENQQEGPWFLPTGTVRDWPQYRHPDSLEESEHHHPAGLYFQFSLFSLHSEKIIKKKQLLHQNSVYFLNVGISLHYS